MRSAIDHWKTAAPWLLFVLFLISLASFWRTRKALQGANLTPHDPNLGYRTLKTWLARHAALLIGLFIVDICSLFYGDYELTGSVYLACLLVYFAALRQLASVGQASRSQVVGLSMVFTVLFLPATTSFQQSSPLSAPWAFLAVTVLFGVTLGLHVALLPNRPKIQPLWPIWPVLAIWLAVAMLPAFVQDLAPHRTPLQTPEILNFLEATGRAEDFNNEVVWGQYAAFVDHWKAAGNSTGDLARFREGTREVMDAKFPSGEFNYLYALPLSRLGFLTQDDAEELDEKVHWKDVERFNSKFYSFRRDDLAIRLAYRDGRLEPALVETLVERITTAAATPKSYRGVNELLECALTLETLGRSDTLASLRKAAHEQLLATYVPSDDGRQASFAPAATLVEHSSSGEVIPKRPTFVWVDATSDAVRAMGRWGAPKGIDLRKLEAYLEDSTLVYERQPPSGYGVQALGALTELRTLPGYQARAQAGVLARLSAGILAHSLLLVQLWMAVSSLLLARAAKPEVPAKPLGAQIER